MTEANFKAGNHNYEPAIKDGKQQPYRHVGKYRKRADARDIVTGKATFLDDFSVPRMIFSRILRSPYAHARIKSINVERAMAVPGVHCVLTYKDLPKGWVLGWPPHKLLMDEVVYFAGDPVAICAADTKDIADEALELVEVEYKKLPAVFDAVEALAPDAPVIFPGKFKSGTNEVDPGVPFPARRPLVADEGRRSRQGLRRGRVGRGISRRVQQDAGPQRAGTAGSDRALGGRGRLHPLGHLAEPLYLQAL